MRVSLKIKLTALISFLVLLVVLAISTLYLSSLTRQALLEVTGRGEVIANEIYNQARTVLAHAPAPPNVNPTNLEELHRFVQTILSADPSLASLMQAAVGYSPTIDYVTITDASLQVLVHNDPGEIGRTFSPSEPYDNLRRAGLRQALRVIYGPPRVYEIVLPVEMGGIPLDVRVGVSTTFLRNQITPELKIALMLSGLAIFFATLSAGVLSFQILRPLETISRDVDRLARGEYTKSLRLDRKDEWGILSSKLNLLGEQIRGEKAAFVQLKENLDQLFSKLTDGLLMFDKHDRLVLATPAVSRFLSRPPEALIHRQADEVFSTGGPLDAILIEAFRRRQSLAEQAVEHGGPEGAGRVALSVQFIDGAGERVGSLVTLRDVGTRAQLENQIGIAAKLAALGRLTSGVAHEVKNPLNAMVLQLELLKSKLGNQDERIQPQLEVLSAEIRRLDRVVKTFLDFTRPVELHLALTDLEILVREIFTLAEPHANQNEVRLTFESNGSLPRLPLDRDLIKQALLNLILNGCQAMPSGGELRVSSRTSPDCVELDVADQGVGIPPETRPKIFSLYFTTKTGGTGVGLAMAFRIIQLHNGSIDFSSEVNRGTTFRVSLPR